MNPFRANYLEVSLDEFENFLIDYKGGFELKTEKGFKDAVVQSFTDNVSCAVIAKSLISMDGCTYEVMDLK